MRIFQAIEATANAAVKNNKTWFRNLHEPLLELGHEVVLFDVAPGRTAYRTNNAALRTQTSEEMLSKFVSEHNKKPFDLFFAYLIDDMIDLEVIKQISAKGVPSCNFSCNNIHQFDLVKNSSLCFDYNLHAEKDARQKFLDIGATPLWFPMASNPAYFKPVNAKRIFDVAFVGANYANRVSYIRALLDRDVDAHVFGPGWKYGASTRTRSILKRYIYLFKSLITFDVKMQSSLSSESALHDNRRRLARCYPENVHSIVDDDYLIRLYSKSAISLGFLEVYAGHDPSAELLQHIHLREYEAPMCRALYCTGFSQELAEHFEPDQEVIVYRNMHELVDKVQYYLKHPKEAEKIRAAGYDRALAEHTYQQRYKDLFKKIGLS